MVRTDGRTDGWTDRRTDTEGYNIIPRHTLVAGYKNPLEGTGYFYIENEENLKNLSKMLDFH